MTSRLRTVSLNTHYNNASSRRSSNDSMESETYVSQRRSLRASSYEKRKRGSIILNNYKIEFDACNLAHNQTNQERTSENVNLNYGLEIENETKKNEKSLFIDEIGLNKPICKPSSQEEEYSNDFYSMQNDLKYYKLDAYERTIFKLSGNHLRFTHSTNKKQLIKFFLILRIKIEFVCCISKPKMNEIEFKRKHLPNGLIITLKK